MILVVEDYADARRALVRLLTVHGYDPVGVATGAGAVRFLATSKPRLVILDYNLPDMDGVAVLRALDAAGRLDGLPVVVFSAGDALTVEPAVRAAGARAFIRKGSLDWPDLYAEIVRYAGEPGTPAPQRNPLGA